MKFPQASSPRRSLEDPAGRSLNVAMEITHTLGDAAAPTARAKADTRGRITFVRRPTGAAYLYVFAPPSGMAADSCEPDERLVDIADARAFERPASLDQEGFQLLHNPTRVRSFDDVDDVRQVYYRECEQLVRQACGAREVIVFDHLVRKRQVASGLSALGRTDARADHAGPAGRAHNDYTAESGARRLNMVLGRAEDTPAPGRFAIFNIWRSARGPVLDAPLALCDASSVHPGDLVPTEIRYPHRTGAIYQVAHGAGQRWCFFPELQPAEAIIFKQYDSHAERPRFTPHAAFEHPGTPRGAPPRQSIETRCLALF
jgi:hypothetical protein